ncbi:MAG: aspartyl-phosphate phosphatase Spo0E family protein [Bacillota bacterium]|nr:aspartyl-phosphate phosphatase Spo0E family protein [Bacillota bacterium]
MTFDFRERLESLKDEIQILRRRLNDVAEEQTFQLKNEEALEISYKLDQLIAEFLRIRERLEREGEKEPQAKGTGYQGVD